MCTDEYRRTLCGVCEKESTEQERKKSEDTRTEECETAKKERRKCPKEQRNDQERDGSCQEHPHKNIGTQIMCTEHIGLPHCGNCDLDYDEQEMGRVYGKTWTKMC
ncbi:Uncharacterized protein HZ326_20349 [Fusarium oxysporum f. sp. albedinis]|nr:Uncharacterized protein HZ326_20349 [Fusarium oxysporum f. sp. albedinis]